MNFADFLVVDESAVGRFEVAQDDVKTTDQILSKVDEAKKAGRKSVLLLVDRQGDLRFVAVKIDS